jgi:short chain dehydrogenase
MEKKVWYLTGASKGLGLALIKKLLAAGHSVAAASPFLSTLVGEVGKTPDAGFLPLELDPADENSVARSIRTTWETFGCLDIVVNNAGFGAADPRDTATVIRNVLPWFSTQGSGHIINVGLPESWAPETQYPGIRLTAVVLGASHTPIPAGPDPVPAMTIPIDGRQMGDPKKAATALLTIAALPQPPSRLFLTSIACSAQS